jgi:hypothetical protein
VSRNATYTSEAQSAAGGSSGLDFWLLFDQAKSRKERPYGLLNNYLEANEAFMNSLLNNIGNEVRAATQRLTNGGGNPTGRSLYGAETIGGNTVIYGGRLDEATVVADRPTMTGGAGGSWGDEDSGPGFWNYAFAAAVTAVGAIDNASGIGVADDLLVIAIVAWLLEAEDQVTMRGDPYDYSFDPNIKPNYDYNFDPNNGGGYSRGVAAILFAFGIHEVYRNCPRPTPQGPYAPKKEIIEPADGETPTPYVPFYNFDYKF